MGAFATLRIPISATGSNGGALAADTAYRSAGTWNSRWDAAAGELTVDIQFPGNISAMIGKLRAKKLAVADRIGISVPLRSIAANDLVTDTEHFLHLLAAEPNIFSPRIEGDRVVATIVPETGAAHVIYDHCLEVGLFPQDTPTLPALRGL